VSFGSSWFPAFCDGVVKDAAYDLVAIGGDFVNYWSSGIEEEVYHVFSSTSNM
jgi:hypothetical protein